MSSKLRLGALAFVLASALPAQDLTGDWQGKLNGSGLRLVVRLRQSAGAWKALLYSVDQGNDGVRADSVTFDGSVLKVELDSFNARYEGTISSDGGSIKGSWSQGAKLPLDLTRATEATAWLRDAAQHTSQFVTVDNNVSLEVLDWGGSGRPVVFLAGLGNTAHVFDEFAPKLTSSYHVYGITRRGFGFSSSPETGYSADRLGDDVLAVIDFLKLQRPVLIGHSIAGEELSSIGSRHPERVAGLVYLDAGYGYAFYDAATGDARVDSVDVRKKLEQVVSMTGNQKKLIKDLIETDLPRLQKDLKAWQKEVEANDWPSQPASKAFSPSKAVLLGEQEYTNIKAPVLAFYALPHKPLPAVANNPEKRAAAEAHDMEFTGAQAKAFETGIPGSRVLRLPHADHYVFKSNPDEVLSEINKFIAN